MACSASSAFVIGPSSKLTKRSRSKDFRRDPFRRFGIACERQIDHSVRDRYDVTGDCLAGDLGLATGARCFRHFIL
jgi:hypothetical protein